MITIEIRQTAGSNWAAVAVYPVRGKLRTKMASGKTSAHALRRIIARLRRNGHGGKPWAFPEGDPVRMKGTIPPRPRQAHAPNKSPNKSAAPALPGPSNVVSFPASNSAV